MTIIWLVARRNEYNLIDGKKSTMRCLVGYMERRQTLISGEERRLFVVWLVTWREDKTLISGEERRPKTWLLAARICPSIPLVARSKRWFLICGYGKTFRLIFRKRRLKRCWVVRWGYSWASWLAFQEKGLDSNWYPVEDTIFTLGWIQRSYWSPGVEAPFQLVPSREDRLLREDKKIIIFCLESVLRYILMEGQSTGFLSDWWQEEEFHSHWQRGEGLKFWLASKVFFG